MLLWALKPAEDGIDQGIIARLWNLSASSVSFSMSVSPGSIVTARHVTHIETPLEESTVADGSLFGLLAPQQLGTFSIALTARTPVYLPLILKDHSEASVNSKACPFHTLRAAVW